MHSCILRISASPTSSTGILKRNFPFAIADALVVGHQFRLGALVTFEDNPRSA